MIRHQAVRVHRRSQVSEVVLKVFILRKGDLPIVTALNDVMTDAG